MRCRRLSLSDHFCSLVSVARAMRAVCLSSETLGKSDLILFERLLLRV